MLKISRVLAGLFLAAGLIVSVSGPANAAAEPSATNPCSPLENQVHTDQLFLTIAQIQNDTGRIQEYSMKLQYDLQRLQACYEIYSQAWPCQPWPQCFIKNMQAPARETVQPGSDDTATRASAELTR